MVWVALLTTVIIGAFVLTRARKISSRPPSLPLYRSIDAVVISSKDADANAAVSTAMHQFEQANQTLLPAGSEMFDGCGLSAIEAPASGEFAARAGYAKECTLYVQAYYSSVDGPGAVTQTISNWIRSNYGTSSLAMDASQECLKDGLVAEQSLYEVSVYTLDASKAKADAAHCGELVHLEKPGPWFSADGLLSGAAGTSRAYQEVRKHASLDRASVIGRMRSASASSLVVLQWRTTYYKHRF